jgi:hypothetical protein
VSYPQDQIEELKQGCDGVATCNDSGIAYLLLTNLGLPTGCTPATCDALLCPAGRDGYPSRLFLSQPVQGPFPRNWNFKGRICERDWVAFSWKVNTSESMRLAQLVRVHLDGFRRAS